MTPADWRALIEAYLDGRLSAEAFMRRFVEGWRASSGRLPGAIASLQSHVEAFEAQVLDVQEEGIVNDDELRQAAQRALSMLDEDVSPAVAPHTFDRTRAREDVRRFQVQMSGCVGVGCVIALIWVALCILQIYFVSEWIQAEFEWGAWPSAVIGFCSRFRADHRQRARLPRRHARRLARLASRHNLLRCSGGDTHLRLDAHASAGTKGLT